jgi:hypothetical protein
MDIYPSTYVIYQNNTINDTGIWESGIVIDFSIDGLSIGRYNFTIFANDTLGNLVTDEVIVVVGDQSPPVISNPSDVIYLEGVAGNTISWLPSDTNPATYTVYKNGTVNSTGIWQDNVNIIVVVDGLQKGSYNFTLLLLDASGNIIMDTVMVYVVEYIIPVFVAVPTVLQGPETSSGKTLVWNATDDYPGTYEIFRNSTLIASGSWSNEGTISIILDGLSKGIYNFSIVVYDESDNYANNTIYFQVTDETDPEFMKVPPNFALEEGSSGNVLEWIVSDKYPSNYQLLLDGVQYAGGIWGSGNPFSLNIDFLTVGYYNFTIVVFDQSSNSKSHSNFVTVLDSTPPLFESTPGDVSYNEGTIGHSIAWIASDEYENQFEIYRNGTLLVNDVWISFIPISISIDNLIRGVYNFTILIYDSNNNTINDTVITTVFDSNFPLLVNYPQNMQIIEGSLNNSIFWIIEEQHPQNYIIYQNGKNVSEGAWVSESPIHFNLDQLEEGEYNITLTAWDESSNTLSHTIIITVNDKTPPNLLVVPDYYEFYIGGVDHALSWMANDQHPSTYSLLKDGGIIVTGVWNNNEIIEYSLNALEAGYYNFTIILYDNTNNNVFHTVFVKAKDPSIIETATPLLNLVQVVKEGDVELSTGNWVALFSGENVSNGKITVSLYEAAPQKLVKSYITSTDENGYYSLEFNYTNFEVQNYLWNIKFEKESYEGWIIEIPIEVIPHDYLIDIQASSILQKGEQYFISATVYFLDNDTDTSTFHLSQYIRKEGKAAGIEIFFNIEVSYDDGTSAIITKSALTASNGVAVIEIKEGETITIASIDAISAHIPESEYGNPTNVVMDKFELPTIKDPNPGMVELLVEALLEFFLLIILLVFALVFMLTLLFLIRRNMRKRYKIIQKEMNVAKTELDAILSIRAIIIQLSSGIPMYERKITSLDTDTSLISGLISALSAFLGEVSREELFGFETMERQGLSITSHKGQYSKLTIISSDVLPLMYLDKIEVVHEMVEQKFGNQLGATSEGDPLDPTLVDTIFEEAGLNLHILNKLFFNRKNIRRIKRIPSISRNLKDNVQALAELYNQTNEETVSIMEILDYFNNKNMSPELSARAILLAFKTRVLIPQVEPDLAL